MTRKRWWLQPNPNDNADSYVVVESTIGKNWSDISLKVADCNRSVSLYFPIKDQGKPNRTKQARAKLAKIQKAVNELERIFDEIDAR